MSTEAQRASWREKSKKYASNNKVKLATKQRNRRATDANISRAGNLKTKYGLTLVQWDSLFIAQGSCCAICKSLHSGSRNWHTDHDHTTGKIRGILCHWCNLMVGNSKDNVQTLSSAIEYLRRYV